MEQIATNQLKSNQQVAVIVNTDFRSSFFLDVLLFTHFSCGLIDEKVKNSGLAAARPGFGMFSIIAHI